MRQERVLSRPRLLAAALLVALLPASAASAQSASTFAIGAGGSIVNDTGTASDVGSFGTAGAHLFGEMAFERWAVLQLRVSRFGLPGTQPDAPNLRADSGSINVMYLFREEWWHAGLYVGAGIYRLQPRDLETGQVPADEKETAFGWTGGVLSIFDLSPRWDLRLEVAGHIIRTAVQHKPIFVTGGIAYHF